MILEIINMQQVSKHPKLITAFLLVCITLLGFYLRWINLSPYKFYPDAYQNLLVAKNILENRNVMGTLGIGGILYPSQLMWTRPIYALLILIASIFVKDFSSAAQYASFFAGVATIPLSYLLIKIIYKSVSAALFGAFLCAISFNHTVWSSFIMSDTTGIALSFTYFLCLFSNLKPKSQLLNISEITTGVVFAFAVYARYEYVIFILPTLFLLLQQETSIIKIANIFFGFFITASAVYALLFPSLTGITSAISSFTDIILGVCFSFIVFALLYSFVWKRLKYVLYDTLSKASLIFVAAGIFLFLNTFIKLPVPFFTGFSNFASTDFMIIPLFFIGLACMFRNKKQVNSGVFCLLTFISMEIMYLRINPLQQRYTTHLLPIFVICAAEVYIWISKKPVLKKRYVSQIAIALFAMLILYQLRLSYYGLTKWSNGDWNRVSYEEQSALNLNKFLKNGDVIVVSMPEPYYYFTEHSTQSITPKHPYYIETNDLQSELIIVNDMGMRDIFPEFSSFVTNKLKDYKIAEYKTDTRYHYIIHSEEIEIPVEVYRISLDKLHEKLR